MPLFSRRPTAGGSLHAGAALVVFLALVAPIAADVIPINPFLPPVVTLPPPQAAKLLTLLSASFPSLLSDVSPDDRTVLIAMPSVGVAFMNLQTKATVPVSSALFNFQPVTELRWRDDATLVFVAIDATGALFLVSVDRGDGAVASEPLEPTGFPVSLSTNGGRLLVARLVGTPMDTPEARALQARPASPFVERSLATFKRPGPAIFDMDKRLTVRVTTVSVEFAVFDIASAEDRVLIHVAPETALLDVEWSRADDRLALVRWQFPDNSRGGVVPTESDSVQDGLGRLPPRDNPFFTSNALDLFSLDRPKPKHVELRPRLSEGELFADAVWSPDARRIMVQMWEPGTIKGRRYPTFVNANRSTIRFYSAQGRHVDTLARDEVGSPVNLMFFVSDEEAIIYVPFELSFRLYSYNLKSHAFRRLSTESGAIYQVRATRQSRELVYNFGSFTKPYELYKIHVNGVPTALTNINAAVAMANEIRIDKVRFRLGDDDHHRGGRDDSRTRTGFLLQPKGASFPPRNVPLVVWQQGGPTSTMTEDWGGFVEQPFNILPNFGFAVLMVPLPGRIGFGAAFLDELADGKNFGQVDIDEQVEIVEQLVDRGYTSHPRLGITGCSYGGYFTSQSITRHPDVYAAANTQCTLLDLFNEFELGYRPVISYLMGRTPTENAAEYTRDSPVLQAARVRAPTLIFAGTADFLPYTISQRFHDDINAAGTLSDFYVFQGEGHGLAFITSQFVAGQAQIEWFRRHLAHD
jgi:dipeptidyl aminopeptidase/acylaminoacyl peptidase